MGWVNVRLGDILERKRDTIIIKSETEYKLVTIKLHHKGVVLRNLARGNTIKSKMTRVKAGDFVLSGIDARNGAFGIVPDELEDAIISNDFWCLVPNEKVIKKEFLLFITSTEYFDYICKQSSDGTTQRIRLQKDKFFDYRILIPTISEQDQILKKLNHQKVLSEDFASENLHQLELLKKLRQQIIKEAIQGILIPQDAKDEHASKLLERIILEKDKLIKAKKIKKEKPLPDILPEEIPFKIPQNWVWCRLGEIGVINPRNYISDSLEVAFVPMTLISEKYGEQAGYEIRKWKDIKSGFTHFANNDVAIAKITPCFENSKATVFKNLKNGFGAGTTELHVFRCFAEYLDPEYIYANLKTDRFLTNGKRIMRGVAGQQRVPTEYFRNFLIPLPPINEQYRIATKVTQLMKLSDELEQTIRQNITCTKDSLRVMLKEALTPVEN